MSLTGCTVGATVAWPPMRELAENIDALAVALNTPGYTPLLGITDAPFQFEDKVAATGQFYQFFSVSDSGMVAGRYLAADELGAAVYTFPETNLGELIAHDELFFIMDQDDCLCKTLFKVEGSPELPTFVEASASGCCQSIPVPEVGALVYQNQHFFPSAILAGYFGTSFEDCCGCCVPSANPTSPACLGSSDATMYVKTGAADENGCSSVTGVSRNIVSGYFTWPFKKRYMELLVDKLDYILQCSRNDGIKPRDAATPAEVSEGSPGATLSMYGAIYSVDGGTTNSGWFKQGSTCSAQQVDQWLASLWIEGTILDTEPGTLVYGTGLQLSVVSKTKRGNALSTTETRGEETITDSPYDLPRPWDGPTPPDATDCSNGLPMVYAYTLNKLNDLVTEISERVWPYGTFDPFNYSKTCDDSASADCCYLDGNHSTGSTKRSCAESGGRELSEEACLELAEELCVSRTRLVCGVEQPCEWISEERRCACSEICIDPPFCCCPSAFTVEQVCQGPGGGISPGELCPPDCYPAQYCNVDVIFQCLPVDGIGEPVEPIGFTCPPDYYLTESREVTCEPYTSGYEGCLSYTPLLTEPPTYPNLPPCEDEPCCLRHPAFLAPSDKNCLSYINEVEAFVAKATNNAITSCRFLDLCLTDRENPESSPVEDCEEVWCGLVCEEDYLTVSEGAKECLDQAQVMYSWQRRQDSPDEPPGWPLSPYYDIVFSAPSPI